VRHLAVARRRLARLGGGISVPRCHRDPPEGLRRSGCTVMGERGRIMRAGRPIQGLLSMPARHPDSMGGGGGTFRRGEPTVLASVSKRNHATAGFLASLPRGLAPERGRFGCLVRTPRDAFRPIDTPLHVHARSLR
jgi:hypothetical protein